MYSHLSDSELLSYYIGFAGDCDACDDAEYAEECEELDSLESEILARGLEIPLLGY